MFRARTKIDVLKYSMLSKCASALKQSILHVCIGNTLFRTFRNIHIYVWINDRTNANEIKKTVTAIEIYTYEANDADYWIKITVAYIQTIHRV